MKKEAMKARGIRFSAILWSLIVKQARIKKVKPSDIVREAVEDKYLRRES